MLLVICILIVNVNGSWWRPNWIPPTSDTSCSFTRDDVFRVLKQYVDVNPKDDKITEKEVEEALSKYLPLYLRAFVWIGNGVPDIFKNCDYDKNGVITAKDFYDAYKVCLPNKASWCTVEWFYHRILNQELKK